MFVRVDEKGDVDSSIIPLKYKVYNDKEKLLCEKKSSKVLTEVSYTEEIEIKNYNNENILNLEIDKSDGSKITTIKINLEERTLEIQGEKEELNKISEIELKKFLGYEASMEIIKNDIWEDTECAKIFAVYEFLLCENKVEDYKLKNKELYAVLEKSVADQIAKEVFGETIGELNKKDSLYITYTENGIKYYGMEQPSDICINGSCIDITDISYCGGIYTATFNLEELGGYDRGNIPGEISTRITGIATGINPDTKEIINSNMTIEVYEPFVVDDDTEYMTDSYGAFVGLTTREGNKWFEEYENDGIGYSETYYHSIDLPNGEYAIYIIKFSSDNQGSRKVANIIDWILGTARTTSY